MLLAARPAECNLSLVSAFLPLVLLRKLRLQCARTLDALDFSLNG
jgi:predicted hotdog family 3-hydroxylacyl-ACP dehydratase